MSLGPRLKLTRCAGTLYNGALIRALPSLYTPSQISQYLQCVGFPQDETFSPTFENLEQLTRLHLLAFPFENTEMHYTPEHQMEVTAEGIFKRMVVERKGGSYCFGHSNIFLQVLRGLGYRAYAGCGRVNADPNPSSAPQLSIQAHMVHFVQPFPLESEKNNQTYVIDLWFGGRGLVRPILLSDGDDNVVMGASPYEWHRLTRCLDPLSSLDAPTATAERPDVYWAVEYQRRDDNPDTFSPWQLFYTFTENECFLQDVESASYVVCNKPEGLFYGNIVAVRFLSFDQLDQDGLAEAAEQFARYPRDQWGNFLWKVVVFRNEAKRCIGASSVTIRALHNEGDRIRALNELCALRIPEDGHLHVLGRPPSLASETNSGGTGGFDFA